MFCIVHVITASVPRCTLTLAQADSASQVDGSRLRPSGLDMVQPQPSAFLPRRAPLTNESDWLRLCVIGWAAFLVTLLVLLMAIREWKGLKERLEVR